MLELKWQTFLAISNTSKIAEETPKIGRMLSVVKAGTLNYPQFYTYKSESPKLIMKV